MSGWGTDELQFASLVPDDMDCVMFFDYRTLSPIDLSLIAQYETLHLITWSMGVWIAGHLFKENKELFTTRTAVAGTLNPVDDLEGIPVKGYNSMVDSFNEQVLFDFQYSMFDDQNEHDLFLKVGPKRDMDEIHDELICFQKHVQQNGKAEDIYTSKIVTARDRIFPLKNQIRSWGKQNAIMIKQPHFPFYSLKNFDNLLALTK